ncbi:hypothetical protein [Aureitalea marina]|uniref:Membrane or secreted protein n=1 Tax=Aureitalea marina TaxID=930804 RepID=A0A2S7KRA8_9FLAO|nr:hypothetical protein [Aureitalea marina]PQB05137.1 hypothetical protein BST85_09735 [Aureitalea marina]
MKVKKYIVLTVLFLLPLLVYIFFATGVNNFVKLPVLTTSVAELDGFQDIEGERPRLQNKITVLGFFGSDVGNKRANAFNLAHKIYKKNHQFDEFQFVILVTEDQQDQVAALLKELEQIEKTDNWKFAIGSPEQIEMVFQSLESTYALDENWSSDFVFIIDKERSLRGRDDDEDVTLLYGFNASDYAEINNKMGDDIKVVLAEYRLALKKYKSNREI